LISFGAAGFTAKRASGPLKFCVPLIPKWLFQNKGQQLKIKDEETGKLATSGQPGRKMAVKTVFDYRLVTVTKILQAFSIHYKQGISLSK